MSHQFHRESDGTFELQGMAGRTRKRKNNNVSQEPMQKPRSTSTRTQVGRRVSSGVVQERQSLDQMLPHPHMYGQTNTRSPDIGLEDNYLVDFQTQSSQLEKSVQQNVCPTFEVLNEESNIQQKDSGKKTRGPTHLMQIWGRPSTLPRIHIDFDSFGRAIGPNQSKFCEFLGTIARNGMYCPLDVEDWHKMPTEFKRKMLHAVKSRYDISQSGEDWVLKSINTKWKSWKCNLKTRYFLPDKDVDDLKDERDERVLEEQWINILSYWNKEDVQERSKKNTEARSKRTMNHFTGKTSFAQVYDKIAKEKGRPPSRAELLDACYTSKGKTPFIVSKYLDEIAELRKDLPEGYNDPIGPNDLFAQVSGQDKPGHVRMLGEGVSPSDVWGEVPNRNMCKRIMLDQQSEIAKMKDTIAELASQFSTQQRSMSQTSLSITQFPDNLTNTSSRKRPLQVGGRVALKSVLDLSKIVAEGCIRSIDRNTEVGGQVLGDDWCEVLVQVVVQPKEQLIRPYDFCQNVQDVHGQTVAWPCSLVMPIG